jgi:hypothetical protein
MARPTLDLSIVIVSFNTKELTRACLASIYKYLGKSGMSFEVVLVDNVSTDGTREMLTREFPQVVTILNDKNVGFGIANNQGIRKAKGEWVLLLNSDTVILDDSLVAMLAFARAHPNSFVGPKLLNPDYSPQTSCGPFFSLPVVFAVLFLKGDRIGLTRWSPDETRQVDWLSGACILGPRKLFMDGLLFDEKIFMYMEEVDLLYRARMRGHKTYFYHACQIVHLGGGSSTNKRKGPVLNIYKGFTYFYRKHYGATQLGLLRGMLKLKALVAWGMGIVFRKQYLKETYAEAYHLV